MDKKVIPEKKEIPRITGTLRAKSLKIPEVIYKAKGMVVLGRRIKSVVFTTDVAIIRNCNADAVLAVYPFTPQQVISEAIINAASIPVFCGVGGGVTNGYRSAMISMDAEAQGAYGVVVNAPMSNANVKLISKVIDIPIIATVISAKSDIQARLDAGASILNVTGGRDTADVVREIRRSFPKVPIIATGGNNEESIIDTIEAGADSISWTPPSSAKIFGEIMDSYRAGDIEKLKKPEAGDAEEILRIVSGDRLHD